MRRWRATVGWTLSIVAAAVFLLPLLWMLVAALRPDEMVFRTDAAGLLDPSNYTLRNFADAWRSGGVGMGLMNSCVQVGTIIGAGLVVNSLAAYAFARMEFPGRDLLFAAVVVMIILPIQVLAIPLLATVFQGFRLIEGTLGLPGFGGGYGARIAALIVPFVAKAFNIYFLRQHFLTLPKELEEAAIVDGAGPWQVFWRVAMPSIKPALATVVVIDVLIHWSDFIWPLLIANSDETRTIQISLQYLFSPEQKQWGDIMALAVIATVPVVAAFAIGQKYVTETGLGAGSK